MTEKLSVLLTSGRPGSGEVWHLPELDAESRGRLYGRGLVEMPEVLTAGAYATVKFTFVVGENGLPPGGRFRIAWRWPYDWSDLQSQDPGADGYVTASVMPAFDKKLPEAQVEPIFSQFGDLDPWMHSLDLSVVGERLVPGAGVEVICGEQRGGSQGWRAPTCAIEVCRFLLLVNSDGGARWNRLLDPAGFTVKPGPPRRLVAVAPADCVAGGEFNLIVRAEDRWGNATGIEGAPEFDLLGTVPGQTCERYSVQSVTQLTAPPTLCCGVHIGAVGDYRMAVSIPGTSLATESNPIRVHADHPPLQLFWGDLHSGQTEIGCGAGSLPDHYRYARDAAGLQFITHQANDHYMTRSDWQYTRKQATQLQEPGHYVVFLGCEWSPLTEDGGDRNVIYRYDESRLRRSGRYFSEADSDPEPDIPTAPDFHAAMQGKPVMVNMHVGGRPTNLDYHMPELEPLAEIHSTHGTSEWFIEDALKRGYRIGITAGTDGVMGRPGADHPGWRLNRNVRSGLTAVYAEGLTQDALWSALQARRCYATTGERIRLWFEVDGHAMGAAYTTHGEPKIMLEVDGTAAIERVDLLRGTATLCSWQSARSEEGLLRILWRGARAAGTARTQRLVWDGTLRITDGRFCEVKAVGFHSADDQVQIDGSETILWRSATAGNAAGVLIRVEGDQNIQFHFRTAPCAFDFDLNQVQLAPMTVDAGFLNGQVTVGPAPREDGPRRLRLGYQDTEPLAGEIPYWIRVTQVNQAQAWSSPVYVTKK